jgi:hypothetical protein
LAACLRSEFSDEEWRLVSDLADHPNRLLVTAVLEGGETFTEVAHEAIFRRWDKLREWIAAERAFLVWRSGLEAARRAWQATPDSSKNEALPHPLTYPLQFDIFQAAALVALLAQSDFAPRAEGELGRCRFFS